MEALILGSYPDAQIAIEGQGCDLTIRVVSAQFADSSMVKQHQGVMATLTEPLATGRLHAVTLKTFTPEQWQAQQPAPQAGLLQIQL
nr:BolA/IbaG family iron-sulfur metabolism protein [Methylomonas methanica]